MKQENPGWECPWKPQNKFPHPADLASGMPARWPTEPLLFVACATERPLVVLFCSAVDRPPAQCGLPGQGSSVKPTYPNTN